MVVDDFNFSTSDTPQFNSGISYLERIHNIMNKIHESLARYDYGVVRSLLASLFIELAPRASPKKRTELKLLLKKIDTLLKPNRHAALLEGVQQSNLLDTVELLFFELSLLAHELQLIMPNKVGFIDDE